MTETNSSSSQKMTMTSKQRFAVFLVATALFAALFFFLGQQTNSTGSAFSPWFPPQPQSKEWCGEDCPVCTCAALWNCVTEEQCTNLLYCNPGYGNGCNPTWDGSICSCVTVP